MRMKIVDFHINQPGSRSDLMSDSCPLVSYRTMVTADPRSKIIPWRLPISHSKPVQSEPVRKLIEEIKETRASADDQEAVGFKREGLRNSMNEMISGKFSSQELRGAVISPQKKTTIAKLAPVSTTFRRLTCHRTSMLLNFDVRG